MADPVIVQQLAKRRGGLGDGVPRRPGELAKVNLDGAVLDRLPVGSAWPGAAPRGSRRLRRCAGEAPSG